MKESDAILTRLFNELQQGKIPKYFVMKRNIHYGNLTFYGDIVFAAQNPNGKSEYALAVREGRLKATDVCWLWTTINGKRLWLGVVGKIPEGVKSFADFYTDGKRTWYIYN